VDLPLFVVGNWKSHFTVQEALDWLENYAEFTKKFEGASLPQVVICAPFTVLDPMKRLVERESLPLKLGAQDVSAFGGGAYTGEVSADMLKGLVEFVLVGHSERRRHLGETLALVEEKLQRALASGITPILCASEFEEIPDLARDHSDTLVMFEPAAAISQKGQYHSEDPREVKRVLRRWRGRLARGVKLFYGGSVNPDNVVGFFETGGVDGVVVGNASLDPALFGVIVQKVAGLRGFSS
jgi:triosephosphate isomerase